MKSVLILFTLIIGACGPESSPEGRMKNKLDAVKQELDSLKQQTNSLADSVHKINREILKLKRGD